MFLRLPFALRVLALGLICIGGVTIAGPLAQARDVTVFAAASLKTVLEDITADWTAQTGHSVTLSFAGSSALARQIEAGAPADIFISANAAWMDHLEYRSVIMPDSRVNLVSNELILIAPEASADTVRLAPDSDLPERLGDGHLAMALVQAVPAGIYGKAALEHLDLWEQLKTRIAQTDNVRAALALVARGEAPFGIVYATDAGVEDMVIAVARFPAESHPPITYPAALISDSTHPQAASLLAYLESDTAQATFSAHGFRPVP